MLCASPKTGAGGRPWLSLIAGWKRTSVMAGGSAASPWDCGAGLSPVNSYPERHAMQADRAGAPA